MATGRQLPPKAQRPPGRPRRRLLSREVIAEAVIELGFDNLTLVAVAERLGVAHASLYGHVTDRSDLVLLAADRLIGEASWPEPGDHWGDYLAGQAWVLYRMSAQHPGIARAVMATGRAPQAMARHFGGVCRHLVALGFTDDDALLAADTVFDLAADASNQAVDYSARSDQERRALAEEWSIPIPELAEVMQGAFTVEPERWFARKLDLVLAGIEVRLAPRR